MAEPLKNIYNDSFFDKFLADLPEIDPSVFRAKIYDLEWANRELKQRMRHIALVLGDLLPNHFSDAAAILLKFVERARPKQRSEMNFEYMFLPDFIEIFGLDDFETSVKTMTGLTQFTSCEFAVRPFLIRYGDKMMQQMYEWSWHEHPMVRRLSSEGARPRLPWAMAVPSLKQNPLPILPILETLKDDESETVRRSVANNLNDIAKDHPQIVIDIVEKWRGLSPSVDWVIKHGSRTLLKRANTQSLQNFGFHADIPIEISDFFIDKRSLHLGDSLLFRFSIKNTSPTEGVKVRLEYAIDYVKANGTTSQKVFKITEKVFNPVEFITYSKKIVFKDLTTRKHYAGQHTISLIVNGIEKNKAHFKIII